MPTPRRPQKRKPGSSDFFNRADPLVGPGNPSHRQSVGSAADRARRSDRLVPLAKSPPSSRTTRPHQNQTATVMLRTKGNSDGLCRRFCDSGKTTVTQASHPLRRESPCMVSPFDLNGLAFQSLRRRLMLGSKRVVSLPYSYSRRPTVDSLSILHEDGPFRHKLEHHGPSQRAAPQDVCG